MVEVSAFDKVLKTTIEAVEKGKEQIYDITEDARQEYAQVQKVLEQVTAEVAQVISEVDSLTREERRARQRLMEVSRDFARYTENDMQQAYERAREVQLQLGHMQEKEKQLRARRDQLQLTLRKLERTLAKGEELASQVEMALRLLKKDIREMAEAVGKLQQSYLLGIRVIEAQEEERKRVAREIHDGPAQSLANLVLRTEICEKLLDRDPAAVREALGELREMIQESLRDVRRIIYNLRPMVLDDLGIASALRLYISDLQKQSEMPIELIISGEERKLPGSLEVAVFRIAQEALNNALKHSEAKNILVKLEFSPESINLLVIDDGKGFNWEEVREKTPCSYGLIGMQERVEMLNGKISINTAPNRGTQILVMLPILKGETQKCL